MKKLDKLTKVELREIWKHEALDFTQWLAMQENLDMLAETIGIDLINPQTEVSVGSFNVDILAEDDNGGKVIVENQLESTDHDHLGKLITYGSGLDAEIIIWIVKKAREEHQQAIHWLNDNTNSGINFFLIEMQAWKIGKSLPAPSFNIIAQPNDWAKTIRSGGSTRNQVTDYKLKQQAYWEKFREYASSNTKAVGSYRKALPQHWYSVRLGTSKAKLALLINKPEQYIGCELYIREDKDLFAKLESKKVEIEKLLGKLQWRELPDKKASRILITRPGDIEDESEHDEYILWMFNTVENFYKVFNKRIR